MLSDRRQRVLAALIEEYVARALPVGSRTLTERYQLGVSPATVRNELSVLEDGGYIAQPHTCLLYTSRRTSSRFLNWDGNCAARTERLARPCSPPIKWSR